MVKNTESKSVFDTKSAKERSDYVKDNPDKVVMLSGMNFSHAIPNI